MMLTSPQQHVGSSPSCPHAAASNLSSRHPLRAAGRQHRGAGIHHDGGVKASPGLHLMAPGQAAQNGSTASTATASTKNQRALTPPGLKLEAWTGSPKQVQVSNCSQRVWVPTFIWGIFASRVLLLFTPVLTYYYQIPRFICSINHDNES